MSNCQFCTTETTQGVLVCPNCRKECDEKWLEFKPKLTKGLIAELQNIKWNMPVFAGDLQSHDGAYQLRDMGLVMTYESKYVLTELGKKVWNGLAVEAATDIVKKGA